MAIAEINIRGIAKSCPWISNPTTIGTTIAAQFEKKLKNPPVNPMSPVGESVETSDQVIDANPQPKNETLIKNTT